MKRRLRPAAALPRTLLVLLALSGSLAHAQAQPAQPAQPAPQRSGERIAAPDGAPALAPAEPITSQASPLPQAEARSSVIVGEERLRGRISTARVSPGGNRSYLVVDPNADRAERLPDNDIRRLAPSQWEVFKF